MQQIYYVYHTPYAPAELTNLHPFAAKYLTITLFVTGAVNPPSVVDLASLGFNYPFVGGAEGLAAAELDAMIDSLFNPLPPPTAAEVRIRQDQADYLYETRFKPTDTEEL